LHERKKERKKKAIAVYPNSRKILLLYKRRKEEETKEKKTFEIQIKQRGKQRKLFLFRLALYFCANLAQKRQRRGDKTFYRGPYSICTLHCIQRV
jgi:hypothetical protein